MSFLFPFLNFFQPGVFWPGLADYRPMLIASLLSLVVGMSSRANYRRLQIYQHPVFFWLVAFLLAQIFSVYREGIGSTLNELSYWGIYFLFVLAGVYLMATPVALRRFVWGAIVGSMFIVYYGIYAHFAGLEVMQQGRAGAYGEYENHNDYSFIIIMSLPFTTLYFVNEKGFMRRAFLAVAFFACILGILLSLSRGGMLALVLELVLLALIAAPKKWRFPLIGVLMLVGAGAISYQWASRAANQGDNYTAEDAQSSRFELWRAGENMILAHPILGVGSRRFGENSSQYAEISHDNLGKNAHNTYIDVLACTGFLGFIPFLMMIIRIWQSFRRPVGPSVSNWIDVTRTAGAIALPSIIFRGSLDAKSADWSFYLLATIGIATSLMQRGMEVENAKKTSVTSASRVPGRPLGRQISGISVRAR